MFRPAWMAVLLATGGAAAQAARPEAPSDLRARLAPGERVEITWKDNSQNEDGFWIERKTVYEGEADSFQLVYRTSPNTTRYTHVARIRPGEVNYFRVRAFNRSGNSSFSNTAVYRR